VIELQAVLVKGLAIATAWGAVLAFRRSRRAGMGLLPKEARYRQVVVDSLFYPAAVGAVVATLALLVTSRGWDSVKLATILGGGLFAVFWPFFCLSRVFFAKIAFDVADTHRAFADENGLGFEMVGPEFRDDSDARVRQSIAAVRFGDGHWLALVDALTGPVGNRGYAQKTRLELPVAVEVREPEVWNLKPVGGLLGEALAKHADALAALGSSLSLIRLERGRLVLMGAPNRSRERVAALVDFAATLAASLEELAAGNTSLEA
jgi:hypothetical protein